MARKVLITIRKLAVVLAWVAGGGGLVAIVFATAFYLAMKMEMRSTEVRVPDLQGATEDVAVKALAPLGLRLDVVEHRHDPAMSSGRVLQQDPLPGSSVRRGRRVKVVVSLGGKVLTVPELRHRPGRTVGIMLRQEGFLPGDEARAHSYDDPPGAVMAQVPSPGSPAVPGERVHRLVSLGPPEAAWVIPDLTGRPRREVERWLKMCGFRVGPAREIDLTGRPPGIVVGQLPLPGYPIRRNEVVRLTVAR